MLRSEGVVPASLGYDRPSTKLLAFLRKHARLASYTAQGNNYVLFDEFWRQGGGGAFGGPSRVVITQLSASLDELTAEVRSELSFK